MTSVVRQKKAYDIVDSLKELYKDYEFSYETQHDTLGYRNEHDNESGARDELDELADFESFPSRFRRAETTNRSGLRLYLEEP